jgi:hypothetical protein
VQYLVGLGSSIILAARLYSREQSSPLYTVNTAGKAVEVSYSTAGRVAMVNEDQLRVRQQ